MHCCYMQTNKNLENADRSKGMEMDFKPSEGDNGLCRPIKCVLCSCLCEQQHTADIKIIIVDG